MSKLCDVKNMYGQDLGISVTNATVSVLKQYDKLPKNMVLISSPQDSEGNDLGMPSLFATDYNGNYLQLTYAIQTKNGLYPNSEGYLQLNVDGKSIKEQNKQLVVDTNNLTYCSFNNLGVAKVSKSTSSRTNSSFPIDTFINADKNGVLYLSDSFLEHIYNYVGNKIYENLYPLIMDNIKGWLINQASIKYYPTDKINILGIDEGNGVVITQQYKLQYNSLSDVSEEVNIDINNNDYPIKEVIFVNNTTTVTEDDVQSTKEIKMYRHSIDFTVVFYPNYNLQNNLFLDNQYMIKFQPSSLEGNQSLLFYFNQNNAFEKYTNEIFSPFEISSAPINLNQLKNNRTFEFSFRNKYKYFEDVDYHLEVLYITSDNVNNTDDAIELINENINSKIEENPDIIRVELSKTNQEDDNYDNWKDKLITVDTNTGFITKLSNISSLYKYILKYTINGERTYTYENTFKVNYQLTNLYKENNYLQLNTNDAVTIYSIVSSNDGSYAISGASLNTTEDTQYLTISQNENNIEIKVRDYRFIYKIFNSLFSANQLREGSDNNEYSMSNIFGESNKVQDTNTYSNEVGFLLVFKANYVNDIYLENGGEYNDQKEYTIYNAITNIPMTDGKYIDTVTNKEIIVYYDENIFTPTHAQYHSLVYPKPEVLASGNKKTLQILSYIKLDSFMLQNSSNREHSVDTNTLWHNFTVYNAEGPNCNIKFGFNYGQFFNDHIKVFNLNYGAWQDPFSTNDPTTRIIYGDMQEISVQNYWNSRFFVGIQKELIENVIDMTDSQNCGISWTFNAIDENGNLETKTIVSRLANAVRPGSGSISNTYNNHEYYMFEINYINEWYERTIEDGVVTINPKIQIVSYESSLKIIYKWKKQQNTSVTNTFNYDLGFTLTPNLKDPDIKNAD